ncbi:hypothetical protein XENOCAPTIV_006121, partial [Xenoophorus captivus]
FPNIGNSCYLNATLQSLLSLEDFFRSITCTKKIWSLVPSEDKLVILFILLHLRVIIDVQDAHEFLITVLSQIQSFAPQLQKTASYLGTNYTCPVKKYMLFRMESTRTCKM